MQPKAEILSRTLKVFDRDASARLRLSGGFASLLAVTRVRDQASIEAERLSLNRYVKKYRVQAVTLASVYAAIRGCPTLRDLQAATENRVLGWACGLPGPPSLSQVSRDLNGMDLSYLRSLLEWLLDMYLELAGAPSLELEEMEALRATIDATLVELSRYYSFAAPGYDPCSGEVRLGAKLSLGILEDAPAVLHVAPENLHDSQAFDPVYLRLKELCGGRDLLLCFDKAYFSYQRLDRLCRDGTYFVTPRKRYSLSKVNHHLLGRQWTGEWLVEERSFKHENMEHRLRWIIAKRGEKEYELLTNLWSLPAPQVLELYRLRWRIEVLFKEAKQLLGLKRPWVRSLRGFMAFTYLVMIAYLLLLIYAELLGLQRPYPLARLRRTVRYTRIRVALGEPPPKRQGREARRWFMQQ